MLNEPCNLNTLKYSVSQVRAATWELGVPWGPVSSQGISLASVSSPATQTRLDDETGNAILLLTSKLQWEK